MSNAFNPSLTLPPRPAFFFALAFLIMLGACFAVPRLLSFLPAVWGVAVLVYIKCTQKSFPSFDKNLALFFGALVILASVSALWAPDMGYAFKRSMKIAAILFSAVVVLSISKTFTPNTLYKNRIAVTAVFLGSLAGAILFFEYYSKFFLMRSVTGITLENMPDNMFNGYLLNRGAVLLTVSCIPITLMVITSSLQKIRQYILLAALYLCAGACLFATDSQTAQIAGVFAILMVLYPAHRKKARNALLGCVLLLMIAAPFLIHPAYDAFFTDKNRGSEQGSFLRDASVPHRLEVWKFASEEALKHPFIGNGVDSLRFLKADYVMENMGGSTVMHPHNAVLQIWLEFGVVGIALVTGFVIFLFKRIGTLPPLQQRYYTLLFIVLLSVLSTGYGLWQAWLLGMMCAVTAMSIMTVRINSSR